MTRAPYLVEPKEGLAGRETWAGEPGGPLSAPRRRGCCAPWAGCRGRPPPATSAGCHGNGGNFPSLGGRKRPPPSSRLRKQNPILLPGEQNGRKATPRQGSRAPPEPRESLLFPGQRIASRRGLTRAEGAEIRPALPPRGPGRRAQPASAA